MSSDKLWTEDLGQLFSSTSIVPTSDMTLEAKMNALTRLVLVSSLVMALFDLTLGVVMLFVSIVVIVAVYSAKKEGYEDPPSFPPSSARFCNDAVPIAPNDPTFVSLNQRLVGPPNPKTLIPPFCVAPSHDLSVWKENDLVQHSAINAHTNFDLNRSGYVAGLPSKCTTCHYVPCMCHVHKKFNAAAAATYRDRLLTQTLQPGVYQKSYVGEPINANIGITSPQPFAPTAVETAPDGSSVSYVQYNPAACGVTRLSSPPQPQPQTQDNVYDPRFTGYGTSYRGYTDDLTGQAKFFYKDVDTVIRPDYIVRSHVDIFPWADRYGPRVEEEEEPCEMRTLANQAFHDATLTFRTELQERQMRKRNAEMWQRRAFPKSTQPQP